VIVWGEKIWHAYARINEEKAKAKEREAQRQQAATELVTPPMANRLTFT
jgi:hypothetical protein